MNLCQVCWGRGRMLTVGCCICTGDVMLTTEFLQWSAANRIPTTPVEPESKAAEAPSKPRVLVFGQKQEKTSKRRKRIDK